MTSVAGIFDAEFEWKKEISVDAEGVGWLSRRAIARLAGVHHSSVQYWLDKISSTSPGGENLPESIRPVAGQSFEGSDKILDVVASCLIKHFAWTAKETSAQARSVDGFLGAKSLRERCREIVDWKPAIAPANMADSLTAIHQLLLKQQEQTEVRIGALEFNNKIVQAELSTLKETRQKFQNAANNHPGVKAVLFNELHEDEPYDGGMTIPQWLSSQGIVLPNTARNAMSRRAAQFYRVDKMKDPLKSGNNVVFYGKDLVYIELAYQSVTGVRY